MGRKKKVVELEETKIDVMQEAVIKHALKEASKPKITPLQADLGRADLNTIAAKINEVIERVNE